MFEMEVVGNHKTSYNSIMKCDIRRDMYSNVVLSGGSTWKVHNSEKNQRTEREIVRDIKEKLCHVGFGRGRGKEINACVVPKQLLGGLEHHIAPKEP
ncbi:unnamed protein product [Caenorhabditis brenneri]